MSQTLESAIRQYVQTMEGWSTPDKCWALSRHIMSLKAGLSVELGVFAGRGLLAMAMAHRHQGYGVAWGFDPWTADACVEGSNDPENNEWWKKVNMKWIYREFVKTVTMHDLHDFCNWAKLHSQKAVTIFDDGTIDLIHVDSNHSEEISCKEVELWSPKIRSGGIWVADDIDWPTMKKSQQLLKAKGFDQIEGTEKWAVLKKK